MQAQGAFPPLAGPPESILLNEDGQITRYHTLQSALNASFSAIGYYHGIKAEQGGADVIYESIEKDPRLKAAVEVLFPSNRGSVSLP
jgi:hypothetical protein